MKEYTEFQYKGATFYFKVADQFTIVYGEDWDLLFSLEFAATEQQLVVVLGVYYHGVRIGKQLGALETQLSIQKALGIPTHARIED